jgi:hypothetical protein
MTSISNNQDSLSLTTQILKDLMNYLNSSEIAKKNTNTNSLHLIPLVDISYAL